MVSSTFTDLKAHRAALILALHAHKLHANVMENDSARLVDVIDSSLGMVRDSAAYIGVIGLKYGQIPSCPRRNPDKLSITELEFNEAQSMGRPVLLFIMGNNHDVKIADVEADPKKKKKLNTFRERAKKSSSTSEVNRVYAVFESLEEFKDKLGSCLSELRMHLDANRTDLGLTPPNPTGLGSIPAPPAFYAAPAYIGRHTFVGRQSQLKTLSDWAKPSDTTNVLLFEAIGGNGKSMLTWEWTTKHAPTLRSDWAGCFWYSFYEKGAIMRQFCQHALAYMTEQPLEAFEKKPMAEMREELLNRLRRQPWLLILDGLERVLVAYHRVDAAEVSDEEANQPTDKILDRDPCDAIRDEDTDLLRSFAAATPSKILVSSRLVPRALLNRSGLPLPGVKPLVLPGLDDADAEELLRLGGVRGTSSAIRQYLTNHCGNHPLVIGVLAGLVNSPGPHRGNFDAWATDPDHGAKLDLASLDLVQSRNHILRAAMDALEPASRQLLSTLALLSYAVDYEVVAALNPHLPSDWEEPHGRMRNSQEERASREAQQKLTATVKDLEHRGLLQYEVRLNRYDLHPVVRGVASGGMELEERERCGQRVVDFFSSIAHDPYEQAKTLEDLRPGLNVVHTLIKLGRMEEAANNYIGVLCSPLLKMDHDTEVLAISGPFFREGWSNIPTGIPYYQATHLASDAFIAFEHIGRSDIAMTCMSALIVDCLTTNQWSELSTHLEWAADSKIKRSNPLARSSRLLRYGLALAIYAEDAHDIYRLTRATAEFLSIIGRFDESDSKWKVLIELVPTDPLGTVEADTAALRAHHQRRMGRLSEDDLTRAESLAERASYSRLRRDLHKLRGSWHLKQGGWEQAAASFNDAVTMARERRLVDEVAETGLALTKVHLGLLNADDARSEAQHLARHSNPAHHLLALLWQAIGDAEQARHHALKDYEFAWADGEPYVRCYELAEANKLLHDLGVPIPDLPPYDASKDEVFPWEADVRAAIEMLRAER